MPQVGHTLMQSHFPTSLYCCEPQFLLSYCAVAGSSLVCWRHVVHILLLRVNMS